MPEAKHEVLVLYGGCSTEHEVSCRSANFILRNLDPKRFDVKAIGIDKNGSWWPQDTAKLLAAVPGPVAIVRQANGPVPPGSLGFQTAVSPPVVFPILHGSFGEDGTMQGLLELSGVPFVGPDTLGSAIGMDKVVSKRLAQVAGVPVVPWLDVRAQHWSKWGEALCARALAELGLPLFVKPARLGSSVGVSKVKTAAELIPACIEALAFDDRIMIEKGLNVREIEVACLGDYDPALSVPGEVIAHADFYSYDAKYLDAAGSSVQVPANLEPSQVKVAQQMARQVFVGLELYGMARVDLFLEKGSGDFYFNEVNTIPGFTEISQYPQLWAASGVDAQSLLTRLVELALQRHLTKRALRRSK
ncbi:MAG: D-alanine--D-alanine ligase [Proteobacteria bacterium]|nr:D-alanine--D-alanine ligase [Pseudomonadota bacterium]